jgi:hypothetical protein
MTTDNKNIVIYNFGGNGDLFHSMPFIKIIVGENPNLFFTFYMISSKYEENTFFHYCFKDILQEYSNTQIGFYNIFTNNKNIYNNSLTAKTYWIDNCIYINLFSVLLPSLNGWDSNFINNYTIEPIWNLENRKLWLIYYKSFFKQITNIDINLDITSTIDLMTLLPKINKTKVESIKLILNNLKYKKNIFFYNQYGGFDGGSLLEDNNIFDYIFKTYENVNIITSKKSQINNSNIYCVEDNFDNKVTRCGENLVINSLIANLCDVIFFRLNGGSEFIFARDYIDNKNTEYIYIGNKIHLPKIHNLRNNVRHLSL